MTFASTAFLGGAGLGALIRTGVSEFSDMTRVAATTNALLRATGGVANISAAGIDRLATRTLKLTGVDDELVKSAENVLLTFRAVRNETGRGNDVFTRATRDALDLSRVFGSDLSATALQLGKALQDPIRGVTALRRSGVSFTVDQQKLLKQLVETGQVLRAQRLILGEVERQVGGTAEAVGRTLPGRLNILRESAKNALGDYVRRLSESRDAAELAASGARGVGQAFGVVRGTVRELGPPLISATRAATQLGDAVGGVGPILAAVAAYKAVGIAVGLSAAAQTAYARATLVATGATTRETAAVAASAGAFRVQAASAATSGFRMAGSMTPLAARSAVAAEEVAAVGTAGRAAAVGLGAGRVAASALGGPIGITAIGVAGLTVGMLALKRRADNAAGSLNATRRSLQGLSQALTSAQSLRNDLAGSSENVSLGNFNVLAAQRSVEAARRAASRSSAPAGSLEQLGLAQRVTEAERTLIQAERDLSSAQQERDRTLERLNLNERQRPSAIAATTDALRSQLAALREQARIVTLRGIPVGIRPIQRDVSSQEALRRTIALTEELSRSGDQVQRTVGGALFTIATSLNRLPTEKEITIAVRLAGQGKSVNDIVRDILGIEVSTEQIRLRGLGTTRSTSAALEQQFQAAKKILSVERQKLQTLKDVVAKRRDDLQAARDQVTAARDSLTAAREARSAAVEALRAARQAQVESQRAVGDAIRQARIGVTAAVHDAKSNLDSLGQSIADAFGKLGGQTTGRGGALGAQFRALRDEVLRGGGGPDTQRTAQRIASRIERAPVPDASKLPQQFADLTDQFNRGKITLPQFTRQFNALISGFNFGAFQREFGTAAANTLRDEIRTFRRQARLITTGPQRAGGGVQQNLVRPLQAVAAGNRQIRDAVDGVHAATDGVAKAQHDVQRTTREIGRAQHRLQEAQVKEERKHTIELRAIRAAVEQQLRVQKAKDRLDKPKPKPRGSDDKNAGDLTNSGAGTP